MYQSLENYRSQTKVASERPIVVKHNHSTFVISDLRVA